MTITSQNFVKPELLAPAGSLESFNAAIEAGADAVYLGVGELNARLRAKNFSIKTLSFLVNQAVKHQVKLYVTVNTLVKQEELLSVLNLLHQLDQLKIDAIIVQDLGLIYLARRHFPNLTLHASTQMVIHNSLGMLAAEKLGIKRVVLSRELTFDEITQIREKTDLELEVFIHGALCYSISGLCLASSCLGGWSGNRGRCTQVCRRKFRDEKESGFYFSPRDFWAVDHIQNLTKHGISCFKIEGRMKHAEYVFKVVSAYRRLLDGHTDADSIREELTMDTGREKTSFFLASTDQSDIIVTDRPSGTGLYIGKVIDIRKNSFGLESERKLNPGDRLRIQNPEGDEGKTLTVEKVHESESRQILTFASPPQIKKRDHVFLLANKQEKNKKWGKYDSELKATPFQQTYPKIQKALKSLKIKQDNNNPKDKLFIKIDHHDWLNMIKEIDPDFLIISGDYWFFNELLESPKRIRYWKQKLVIEFPPFIPETELTNYQELVSRLSAFGIHHWMSSHYSHKWLFPDEDSVFADTTVWTTNPATQKQLHQGKYQSFTYSLEDDLLNIKTMINPNGIMPVFGYIPLFISRIFPTTESERLEDNKGIGFIVKGNNGLSYTLDEQPLCLFHRREKLQGLGIKNYLIDLSFVYPSRKTIKTLFHDFRQGHKTQGTILFNHKSGFK